MALSPTDNINAQTQKMIQEIISAANAVEHLGHLLLFAKASFFVGNYGHGIFKSGAKVVKDATCSIF